MGFDRTTTKDLALGSYPGSGDMIAAGALTAFGSATGTGVPFWIASFNDLAWLTHGAAVQIRQHQQWVKDFHNGVTKLWVALIRFRFQKASTPTGYAIDNITTIASADVSALLAGIGSGDQLVTADLSASPLSFTVDTAEDATTFHWYSVGLVGYGPSRPAANAPAVYVVTNDATYGGGIGRGIRRTNAAVTDQLPDFSVSDIHQCYYQGGAYARTVIRSAARKLWTRPAQLLGTTPQGWNLPVPIGDSKPHMFLLVNGLGFGSADVSAAIHLRKVDQDGSRPSSGSADVTVDADTLPDTHSLAFGPSGGQGTVATTKYGDNKTYDLLLNLRNTGKADALFMCRTLGLGGPPEPVAATLTTRTADTNAVFTFAVPPHGLILSSVLDVTWAGGARTNCRVSTGGNYYSTLRIRDGSGDNFPDADTPVMVSGAGGILAYGAEAVPGDPNTRVGADSLDVRWRSIYAGSVGRSEDADDGYAVAVPDGCFISFVSTVNSLATVEVSWGWEPFVNTIDSQIGGADSDVRAGNLPKWFDAAEYGAGAPAAAPNLRQIIRAALGGSLLLADGNYKTGLANRYKNATPGKGDLCELYGAIFCIHGGTNDAARLTPVLADPDGSSVVLNAVLTELVAKGNQAVVVGTYPQVTAWSPLAMDPEVLAVLQSYNSAFLRSCAKHPASVWWVDPYHRFLANITDEAASWYAGGIDFAHLSTTAERVREYCLWLLANLAAAELPTPSSASSLWLSRRRRREGRSAMNFQALPALTGDGTDQPVNIPRDRTLLIIADGDVQVRDLPKPEEGEDTAALTIPADTLVPIGPSLGQVVHLRAAEGVVIQLALN